MAVVKRKAAYNRRRFKSRKARARAALIARRKKLWAKRIKKAAAVLAALMQLHGTPSLETWVADRLQRHQERATEVHRKLTKGGHGRTAAKKKKQLESP